MFITGIIPGEVISLTDENKMKLEGFVSELIDDLESQYRNYLSVDIPVWWKWFNATPRSSRKDTPFKNASNVIIPYIRTIADAVSSTQYGKIFAAAPRVWSVQTENESDESKEIANTIERHINWASNGNDFSIKLPVYDWLIEQSVIGSSVLAMNYRHERRHIFFGSGTSNRKKIKTQLVDWNRGPVLEHAPRENYLWDTRYRIHEAPLVVREHEYNLSQLYQMAQQDDSWDVEALQSISPGNETSPAKAARDVKAEMDSVDRNASYGGPSWLEPYDIREVHIDLPVALSAGIAIENHKLDPGAPFIPLVVHIARKERKILRIVAEPYHIPHKPFYDTFYRKASSRGQSIGTAKLLCQIQEIMSTLFNQSIDNATRSNAVWAKTTNRRHVTQPLDPAHPILVATMDEFDAFTLHNQSLNNMPLINAANVFGERVSGVNDPLLGRETRAGGHPAPATSTLALLQQQDKMSVAPEDILRETMGQIGRDVAILYQQFETNDDGKLQRVHGDEDAAKLEEFLFPTEPIPTNYMFDVLGMSPNTNPDAEMKRAVVVNQVTNDYWSFVLRIIQTMEQSPGGPLSQMAATQAIEAKTEVYKKFLEASNEDDVQRFIAQLRQPGSLNDPELLSQLAGTAGEIAGGVGSAGGPGPNGAVPTSDASGAIVTPTGGGVLLQ